MDLEGTARRGLRRGKQKEEILKELISLISQVKEDKNVEKFAKAIIEEVEVSERAFDTEDEFLREIFSFPSSNVKMGEMGVGSRGEGDFFVHRKIAEIIGKKENVLVDPLEQDDAGVIRDDGKYIAVSVDGTHSRLSEFPFLAGFHVTRAALRDIFVMGAKPIALLSDMHLSDDGDIGKLFDFTAGVCTVSELADVPLIAGSTLRVGGDMVIGDRMVSAVGAVGSLNHRPTARRFAEPNDVILMTEGAGGGTITTTAIFSGYFDVVRETLNIDFITACNALLKEGLQKKIHSMADVTNGGIRGDANEISTTAGVRLVFEEEKIARTVNKKVYEMLKDLDIDYLGVSLDSLLVIAEESTAREVKRVVEETGVKINEVGYVENGRGVILIKEGKEEEIRPMFRESAYTKVKKIVDHKPPDLNGMKEKVSDAAERAIRKKSMAVNHIEKRYRKV
ncbi:MAG: AIR synthase-related protein [Candidatus Hydrothermarchaeota archaeon]